MIGSYEEIEVTRIVSRWCCLKHRYYEQGGRDGREAGRASRAGRASSNVCGFKIGDGIFDRCVN